MAILLNQESRVLVQGITGKEGQKATAWMRAAGTQVIAGVTPGKGGQVVDGIPVFNSVHDALHAFPLINTTSIYAPPAHAVHAALEAAAAHISVIHVIAEGMPVQDSARLIAACKDVGSVLLGPASIGIIAPGIGKLGSIGGATNDQFLSGDIGLISKSGGLCSEFAMMMTRHHIGQSTVVGIGGDQLIGSTYADLFPLFEADPATRAVVIIGEIGGSYEEAAATAMQRHLITKPVIAFISGLFAQTMPQGIVFGHAGAIVDKHVGTRQGKIAALRAAGAHIAQQPEDVIKILCQI